MFDAVVIGLASMIGAGVFVAFGPAARAAGNGLLVGLVMAAFVAYCNATSAAQLAAIYPESGGAYVYGRKRLGLGWGFVAGWGFVIGKLASCAAMAMTFGTYAAPSLARPLAIGAVLALTAVNYRGVQKTAAVTRVIVALVLAAISAIVAAIWFGGSTRLDRVWPLAPSSLYGICQSAGFLFFSFAGYARLATLGEEVVLPERTIPRAIPLALGIALSVYTLVGVSLLLGLGAGEMAVSDAPLALAVAKGSLGEISFVVRAGATLAALGALLSLIAGVGRTVFAMASNGELPRWLAAVHVRYRVPHRADAAAGLIVAAIVVVADIRSAIGFSSFAVLTYYGVANAAALTLDAGQRRWPRWLAIAGVLGCALLALTLPLPSIAVGGAVLAAGALAYRARPHSGERSRP
jgi:basic amino acid/polyamine antiporter, APA family